MATSQNLKGDLKNLEKSKELEEYRQKHKKAYLASAFIITNYEAVDNAPWNLEFYCPETGKVTTFLHDTRWHSSEDEVLQEKKHTLERLDAEKVEFTLEKVMKAVADSMKDDIPYKIIIILN